MAVLNRNSIFIALLCCITQAGLAQNALPVPRNIQKAFDQGTRSTSGQPGKNYWQNSAAYDLRIRFNPANRLVSGEADIVYTNHSPDTLRQLHLKLYPNYYQRGSMRLSSVDSADLTDGVQFDRLDINGQPRDRAKLHQRGTEMMLPIPALMPGQEVKLSLAYSYPLNKGSHMRTGEIDPGAWFLAYFFPRIAVYDDVDGWNRHPYLGTQEFYNDFCDFNLAVTVPRDYVVWATGDLQNCTEVLALKYCQRLAIAEQTDGESDIIDSFDLEAGGITMPRAENTFRFAARHVTDMAVAISNHYLWKASSVVVDPATNRRTRVDAVFNPAHKDFYEVIHFARKTVDAMSYRFPKWPFPYPHITVFDGLDQMEYPMMVNDNPLESRTETIELTDHEIFHTMFPFYMGTNETKHGWMDEGWATIGEWLITPMIDSSILDTYSVDNYERMGGLDSDLPVMTPSTQQYGRTLSVNSYPKPALGYLYVKDMLGDELFFKGLHHYIRTWQGKHPIPYDFFNCINAGSGVNLDWFWRRWFFENGYPDLALGRFTDSKKEKVLTVENKGGKPLPVNLTVTYTDGSSEKIHRSAAIWEKGNGTAEVKWAGAKTVKEIKLADPFVPDVERKDNVWKAP